MHHVKILTGHFRGMVRNWPVASCYSVYFALCRVSLSDPHTDKMYVCVYLYVCSYVCMYVCMCVAMHVCACVYDVCMY